MGTKFICPVLIKSIASLVTVLYHLYKKFTLKQTPRQSAELLGGLDITDPYMGITKDQMEL